MDINPTYFYKNAEIELVIEDDIITTSRIIMDGECVNVVNVMTIDGQEVPYTPKNRTSVLKMSKEFIDKELEEDGRTECTNMSLIKN